MPAIRFHTKNFYWDHSCSEASSCRSAIRTAKGVVADIGAAAASKSAGLVELSRCNEHSSERDVQSVTTKFQLNLPIPLTYLKKSPGVRFTGEIAVLALRSWLEFLVQHNIWHMLVGLIRPDPPRERAILVEHWRRYRLVCPSHSIWKRADDGLLDLSRTVPLILHSDEGRGRKKAAWLVVAWHSYLGRGTALANECRKKRPYLAMRLNYLGNTHANRLLTAVLPKMMKDHIAFNDLLHFIAQDALSVFERGVKGPDGHQYYGICLHTCGDWQFLVKAGNLDRSYANVEKRPRAAGAAPRGICHMCRAGQCNVPFEDLRLEGQPAWERTMFEQTPWSTPSPLLQIPHIPGQSPEFFAYDLWHAYHLGVGKVWTATCLALISDTFPDTTIDGRFSRLTDEYLRWCEEQHCSPFLTAITSLTIGWQSRTSYPNGMWSKGHITTSFGNFIRDWLERADLRNNELLRMCRDATGFICDALHGLYAADLWLEPNDALRISTLGLRFLSTFMQCAVKSHNDGLNLFIFMPKVHIAHHIFRSMREQASRQPAPYVPNPLAHAVQVDEDYVGKTSRISRRVGVGQSVVRVLQRSLQASHHHWVECKYIRG